MLNPYPYYALKMRGKMKDIGIFQEMPYGRRLLKSYYPYNPRSFAQQTWRNKFAYSVGDFQALSPELKEWWRKQGNKQSMTGMNRFIRFYIHSY